LFSEDFEDAQIVLAKVSLESTTCKIQVRDLCKTERQWQ